MCLKERMLLNLVSIDSIEIKSVGDDNNAQFYIFVATRGSGSDKMQIFHTEKVVQNDDLLDSKEVLIYEPATGDKETLYDFVEREMLGKYEIKWRTGKIRYEV